MLQLYGNSSYLVFPIAPAFNRLIRSGKVRVGIAEATSSPFRCRPACGNPEHIRTSSCRDARPRRHRDPIQDLRAAGMKLVPGQALQERRILVGAGLEDGPVEILVHQEMAQPAGGQHADPPLARIALDRCPPLPERKAALRPRLVGRKVRIEEDRHRRHRICASIT